MMRSNSAEFRPRHVRGRSSMHSCAPIRAASLRNMPIEAMLFRIRCSRSPSAIGSELGCSTSFSGPTSPQIAIISVRNSRLAMRALSFSTEMSSLRENGRWHDQTFRPASSAMRLACSAFSRISATVPRPLMPISTYSTPAFAAAAISSGLMLLVELPTPRHWAVRLAAHTSAAAVNRILFFIASGYLV